jgi:hypothetical protein
MVYKQILKGCQNTIGLCKAHKGTQGTLTDQYWCCEEVSSVVVRQVFVMSCIQCLIRREVGSNVDKSNVMSMHKVFY